MVSQHSVSETDNLSIVGVPICLAAYSFMSFGWPWLPVCILAWQLQISLPLQDSADVSCTLPQKEDPFPSLSKGQVCCAFPLSPFCVFKVMFSLSFPFSQDSSSWSARLFTSPLKVTLPPPPLHTVSWGAAALVCSLHFLRPSPHCLLCLLFPTVSRHCSAKGHRWHSISQCGDLFSVVILSTFLSVSHCGPFPLLPFLENPICFHILLSVVLFLLPTVVFVLFCCLPFLPLFL